MALGKQDFGPQDHMLDDELSEFLLIKYGLFIFRFLLNDLTLLRIKFHVVLGLPTIWPPQVQPDYFWLHLDSDKQSSGVRTKRTKQAKLKGKAMVPVT